jgi:hypothetical protein
MMVSVFLFVVVIYGPIQLFLFFFVEILYDEFCFYLFGYLVRIKFFLF